MNSFTTIPKSIALTITPRGHPLWSNKRVYVLQRVSERTANSCIPPTVKHGGNSIMVWGRAFASWKVEDSRSNLNRTGYQSIQQYHAIPSGTRLLDQGFVLMQDNDPKFTSKLCQRYIKSKEKPHVLQLMSWPVQSADLKIPLNWYEMNFTKK